ncbi:ATP-dependent metallopeptidase FtsH/Yme1/Tma family protein [bacterium]|nr:ATP-dependent metallopeptidase FtsH/Yme1/Tma family protein [bacterium]MBT4552100.1 ATP-dependent metallopeptidase FtsH/Yme1/Tma family protein [bacterium]
MLKKKKQKPTKKTSPKKNLKNLIWYTLLALALLSIFSSYFTGAKGPVSKDFSQFMEELSQNKIKTVTIKTSENLIIGEEKNGTLFKTHFLAYPELINDLKTKGIDIKVDPTNSNWFWSVFLQTVFPFLLIGFLWFFIFRQAQGANNQALSFGKSKASLLQKKDKNKQTTFKDVAGVQEAVEELQEIVDFLKRPKKYQALGAKIPKGVLLVGAPGTGKTLLAKAVAGEANVPFFSLSGSEFVEMFVGVGASRVRDLFKQAEKSQPSIIFVDEIDAVGRHRGAGLGGGHDEREQTLNQLLVEMDGFDEKASIIIIAATNRPDILDPALLRSGRFDRQIVVDKPDIKGRLDILKIHSKNKKFAKKTDLKVIARRTPGFTGADLANLVNEAALLTARENKKEISFAELEDATDRIIAGPEKKSKVISEHEKAIIAYHEAGHALAAKLLPNTDPVHKISICSRGLALGYTLQLPEQDKNLVTKEEIENQIKILLGGRIAEEIQFSNNSITSGASNDISKATDLARNYICNYGMSKKLGLRKFGKDNPQVFLGKDYSDHSKDYSESTATKIDDEISNIIETSYQHTYQLISKNKAKLTKIAEVLIEKEVLDSEELDKILLTKKKKTSRSVA